jgi:hypothetical protein
VSQRAVLACLALAAAVLPVRGATPLESIRYTPDVTVTLGAATVDDDDVASDDLLGGVVLVPVGMIPPDVALDGYHVLPNGHQFFSFETTVALPGGITARPADVVRFDGAAYTLQFDAAARGVPPGVNVDAIGAAENGELLLSFDVGVTLSGVTFDDEDVARFNGATFTSFFDGGAAGVDPALDLDALDYLCDAHLLLSFDGGGTVGGVAFDDEDLLEYDPAASTWELAYDGSAKHAAWVPADLSNAYAKVAGAPPAEVQLLSVNKVSGAARLGWTSQLSTAGACTAYDIASGSLGQLRSDHHFGNAICLVNDRRVATYDDTRPDPSPGSGYYYLARAQNDRGTATFGDSSIVPDPRDALNSAFPCP